MLLSDQVSNRVRIEMPAELHRNTRLSPLLPGAVRETEWQFDAQYVNAVRALVESPPDAAALAPANLSKFDPGLAVSARELPVRAVPPQLKFTPAMPAVSVGQALLRQQLDSWREIEPAVRLGDDAEALHQLRVTGRRIVAMLRLLEAVPVGGARSLRRRVQALLRRTGTLRDLDVQRIELDALNATLTQRELQPLVEQVGRLRMKQQQSMVGLLDSPRVRQLFAALETVATATPARGARIPIATVARRQIRRHYRRVRQQALSLADRASVEQCHQLRLETKKLRYLAEPFAAFYGEPMRQFLRRLRRLQSLLGRINDSHHAIASLEVQIAQRRRLPPAALYAMGRMAAQHQHRIEEASGGLSRAWRRCSGKVWRRLRRRLRERVTQSQQTGPPRA
jgi:CHAD domain-containing protein